MRVPNMTPLWSMPTWLQHDFSPILPKVPTQQCSSACVSSTLHPTGWFLPAGGLLRVTFIFLPQAKTQQPLCINSDRHQQYHRCKSVLIRTVKSGLGRGLEFSMHHSLPSLTSSPPLTHCHPVLHTPSPVMPTPFNPSLTSPTPCTGLYLPSGLHQSTGMCMKAPAFPVVPSLLTLPQNTALYSAFAAANISRTHIPPVLSLVRIGP